MSEPAESPTEAEIGEALQVVIAAMRGESYREDADSQLALRPSKQSLREELMNTLGLAYELGYSEKWMRKAVDRVIGEIKAEEQWDGKKG